MSTEAPRRQYPAVDLLKFISALFVVTLHLGPFRDFAPEWEFIITHIVSRFAVPFFFMASGFFLFRKLISLPKQQQVRYVFRYCRRILVLYLIWTVIYLPVRLDEWMYSSTPVKTKVINFFQESLFGGSYYHLWYLPSLITAVLLGYLLWRLGGFKLVLPVGIALFVFGWMVGQDLLTALIPQLKPSVAFYEKEFYTVRNGLFFGIVFLTLGGIFAQKERILSLKTAIIGLAFSTGLLFGEAYLLENTIHSEFHDLYLSLIPLCFFLMQVVLSAQLKPRPIYKNLRDASVLIYTSHLFFRHWPFISKSTPKLSWIQESPYARLYQWLITLALTLAFSFFIVWLEKKRPFRFLKYLH